MNLKDKILGAFIKIFGNRQKTIDAKQEDVVYELTNISEYLNYATYNNKKKSKIKFNEIDEEIKKQILSINKSMPEEYNNVKVTGYIDDEAFVVNNKENVYEKEIKTLNKNILVVADPNDEILEYKEITYGEDGSIKTFITNYDSISNTYEDDSIIIKEIAKKVKTGENDLKDIERIAQPSRDLVEEYERATGLPIIGRRYYENLEKTFSEKNVTSGIYPYSIEICAQEKSKKNSKRKVQYVYKNKEEYKKGSKPYMVYLEGIDGREQENGIFRLKGNKYIDNSTFRKEDDKYVFNTVKLTEIKSLLNDMPKTLSKRTEVISKKGICIPDEIKTIYKYSIEQDTKINK